MTRYAAIALLSLAASSVAIQAQRAPGSGDSFGHLLIDSDAAACGLQFVDIESGGTPLVWTASGADPAADDGGARIDLPQPFDFYGVTTSVLVVSTNGYLSLGATLDSEDGGDFSRDTPLPAIPDNAVGSVARAMAYHDDLSGSMSGGTGQWQYFADCPRSSDALGAEACTVVQWSDWASVGGGPAFDIQAVLYHESFEIVFQFRPGSASLDGGTIGIQNATASLAAQYRPPAAIESDLAVCIFEPRFPPGGPLADLRIEKDHKFEGAQPAGDVSYTIVARNLGPAPVQSAVVEDPLAAGLSGCEWSCEAFEGASCPSSGSGAIDIDVDLPPQSWVELRLVCDVAAGIGDIVNSATVVTPPSTIDPWPADNVDTDVLSTVAGRAEGLRLRRVGAELELSWDESCLASDVDYEVYRGSLDPPEFLDKQPLVCSTGAQRLHRIPTPAASEFYLVVPTNLTFEGSYGATSSGLRPAAAASCRPQSIAACP